LRLCQQRVSDFLERFSFHLQSMCSIASIFESSVCMFQIIGCFDWLFLCNRSANCSVCLFDWLKVSNFIVHFSLLSLTFGFIGRDFAFFFWWLRYLHRSAQFFFCILSIIGMLWIAECWTIERFIGRFWLRLPNLSSTAVTFEFSSSVHHFIGHLLPSYPYNHSTICLSFGSVELTIADFTEPLSFRFPYPYFHQWVFEFCLAKCL
jgi:hypothetical protein